MFKLVSSRFRFVGLSDRLVTHKKKVPDSIYSEALATVATVRALSPEKGRVR